MAWQFDFEINWPLVRKEMEKDFYYLLIQVELMQIGQNIDMQYTFVLIWKKWLTVVIYEVAKKSDLITLPYESNSYDFSKKLPCK